MNQRALRSALGFRGEGAYFNKNPFWAKGIRNVGQAIGTYFGQPWGVGPAAGAAARHGAGALSKWLGFGEYSPQATTSGNTLMLGGVGTVPSQQTIEINNTADETGDIVMAQTEFIGNVYAKGTGNGPSDFSITSYPINPALTQTFPFLSQIAKNFDLYKFEGLAFQYKPTSGEANLNSNSLGKVIMATNYDPSAPDFFNSIQMENYEYANSSKPSLGMVHGVETANRQNVLNMLYTRALDNESKPLEFTDLGKFQIATEGVPLENGVTETIVGELWVTYTVKLSRAQLYTSILPASIQQYEFDQIGASGAIELLIFAEQNDLNASPMSQILTMTNRVDSGDKVTVNINLTDIARAISTYWIIGMYYQSTQAMVSSQNAVVINTALQAVEDSETTAQLKRINSTLTKVNENEALNAVYNHATTFALNITPGQVIKVQLAYGNGTANGNIPETTNNMYCRIICNPITKDNFDKLVGTPFVPV